MPEGPVAAPLFADLMLLTYQSKSKPNGDPGVANARCGRMDGRSSLVTCQFSPRGQRAWGNTCALECMATTGRTSRP